MRSLVLLSIFLPLLAFSQQSREVHYWFNADICHAVGYHSGRNALELRDNFMRVAGFGPAVPKCRFHPAQGHYGGRNYLTEVGTGGAGVWVNLEGVQYANQCNWIETDGTTGENCALLPCQGCRPGVGYYYHKIVSLPVGHPLNKNWMWNGEAGRNRYVRDFSISFDGEGNVNSPSYTLVPPAGGILANPELGIVGTGSWSSTEDGGPFWDWDDGIVPPVDGTEVGEVEEGVTQVNVNLEGVISRLDTANGHLNGLNQKFDLLNSNAKDYTSVLSDIKTGIDNLEFTPEPGASMKKTEDLLEDINSKMSVDADIYTVPDASGVSEFTAKQDQVLGVVSQGVGDTLVSGRAFASYMKGLANSLFGTWAHLPSDVKPDLKVDFTLPLLGHYVFDPAEKIPESCWRFIKFLRACEVLGLAYWFMMAVSRLIEKTILSAG